MRLSESQLDAVARRELQEVTSRWHAPRPRPTATMRARRGWRLRGALTGAPMAGAVAIVVAASVAGLVLHPSFGNGVHRGRAGATVAQSTGAERPRQATGASMAWDDRLGRAVLVTPGSDGRTWTWGDAGWRLERTATPRLGAGAAIAYDPQSGDVLLVGSPLGGSAQSETWAFDGAAWHQLHPADPPSVAPAAMAWDRTHSELILVAGRAADASTPAAMLTYQWTGGDWARLAPVPPPQTSNTVIDATLQKPAPAFRAARLADDPASGGLVLIAQSRTYGWEADTFTWDGSRWHDAGPISAFAFLAVFLDDAGLAYDPASRQVMLYEDATTWGFAQGWSFLHDHSQDAGGPPIGGGMVTDPRRGRVILFGGPTSADPFASAWTWDGHTWRSLPN